MDKENLIYLSFDADSAGRKVGQAILHNNPEELKDVSDRITFGNEVFDHWAKQFNGIQYSSGGDQGVYAVSKEAVEALDHIRKDYQYATNGLTLSIGVGSTLSESGKALLSAKFRGKNQVVFYDESVEKDIEMAKDRVSHGQASPEEQKLGEAYLKEEGDKMDHEHSGEDCKYCNEAEGANHEHTGDDCEYCKQAEAEEHGHSEENCQYCQEANEKAQESQESSEEECQYCKDAEEDKECKYCDEAQEGAEDSPQEEVNSVPGENSASQQSVNNFTAQSGQNYEPAGLTPPTIEKPIGNDPTYQGQGKPEEEAPQAERAANAGIEPGDEHSQEAMAAIAQAIEGQKANGEPDESVSDIDDADLAAVGDAMEGGVSRPEDYDENNTPGDMGLAEDEVPEDPDLSEVLQGGLDAHADNIQREKVIEMVSTALAGFKAQKQILEKAKEQAPQLYEATIVMLRAMIEMAKMIGFGDEAPSADAEQPAENQDEEPHNWSDPFPVHPDNGGEAAGQEDAAQDPKTDRQ